MSLPGELRISRQNLVTAQRELLATQKELAGAKKALLVTEGRVVSLEAQLSQRRTGRPRFGCVDEIPSSRTSGSFKWGSRFKQTRFILDVFGIKEARVIHRAEKCTNLTALIVPGDRRMLWKVASQMALPYVLLEHDVHSWRSGEECAYEKEMIEGAAAVIFASEYHEAYCAERYNLPPHATVHLRPRATSLAFDPLPPTRMKTLVYAGGIVPWSQRTQAYGYRAYHNIFTEFMRAGWEVHIYAPYSHGIYQEYRSIGCVTHDPVPQDEITRELSQYTAGFHGYNTVGVPASALDYAYHCMPNKTWEYLAAGIPTIGINSGLSGKVFDGRWGKVKPDDADTYRWLKRIERHLPVVQDQDRLSETMDQDILLVARLLSPLLGDLV